MPLFALAAAGLSAKWLALGQEESMLKLGQGLKLLSVFDCCCHCWCYLQQEILHCSSISFLDSTNLLKRCFTIEWPVDREHFKEHSNAFDPMAHLNSSEKLIDVNCYSNQPIFCATRFIAERLVATVRWCWHLAPFVVGVFAFQSSLTCGRLFGESAGCSLLPKEAPCREDRWGASATTQLGNGSGIGGETCKLTQRQCRLAGTYPSRLRKILPFLLTQQIAEFSKI